MHDENIDDIQLAEDIQTHGCPVCNRIWHEVMDFFSSRVYSLANDKNAQKETADSPGLCPFHIWQLVSIGSPQGISLGYEKLVKRITDELGFLSLSIENDSPMLSNIIIDSADCRACSITQKTENSYIKRLALFLTVEDNKNIYISYNGVCLRHLSKLMIISGTEMKRLLLNHASSRFRQWSQDMYQYGSKQKNSQRHLCTHNERIAHLIALTHIAGRKHVHIGK
jgi:hypothetical protein